MRSNLDIGNLDYGKSMIQDLALVQCRAQFLLQTIIRIAAGIGPIFAE